MIHLYNLSHTTGLAPALSMVACIVCRDDIHSIAQSLATCLYGTLVFMTYICKQLIQELFPCNSLLSLQC